MFSKTYCKVMSIRCPKCGQVSIVSVYVPIPKTKCGHMILNPTSENAPGPKQEQEKQEANHV